VTANVIEQKNRIDGTDVRRRNASSTNRVLLGFCFIFIANLCWDHNDVRTIQQEKDDDNGNQLFVFFPEDEKVGVKPIKTYTDRMRAEGVSNAIMVLRVDITPFAKQAVQEMSDSFRLEHFKESEFC
jgi:hypothetical protein